MHRAVKNQQGELPFPKCQAYNLQNDGVAKKIKRKNMKKCVKEERMGNNMSYTLMKNSTDSTNCIVLQVALSCIWNNAQSERYTQQIQEMNSGLNLVSNKNTHIASTFTVHWHTCTNRITVNIIKVSVPILSSKEFSEKINRGHKQRVCRLREKSLVLLMYNDGLSETSPEEGQSALTSEVQSQRQCCISRWLLC